MSTRDRRSPMELFDVLEDARVKHADTYEAYSSHVYYTCWRCKWWRRCPEGRRLEADYRAATIEGRAVRASVRAERGQA